MDRNQKLALYFLLVKMSLSARRAWIEIAFLIGSRSQNPSLSARRAWIEISAL